MTRALPITRHDGGRASVHLGHRRARRVRRWLHLDDDGTGTVPVDSYGTRHAVALDASGALTGSDAAIERVAALVLAQEASERAERAAARRRLRLVR